MRLARVKFILRGLTIGFVDVFVTTVNPVYIDLDKRISLDQYFPNNHEIPTGESPILFLSRFIYT